MFLHRKDPSRFSGWHVQLELQSLLTFHKQGLWKEHIHSGSNSGPACYQLRDTGQFF